MPDRTELPPGDPLYIDPERARLGEAFESACAIEATMYTQGADTTHASEHVNRLLAELQAHGWA